MLEEYEIKKLNNTIKQVKQNIEDSEAFYNRFIRENNSSEDEIYQMDKIYTNKIKNLKKALEKPYFARVDFKADDMNYTEKIYIGKTNVTDDNSNIVVTDWRAPISSIYYDGKIGRTQYECPEGIISGNLSLKRQYEIENGNLINYKNIDITTNDQMLQDCLNKNSDVRLKNIVSTIQAEQNKIIRANMFEPLIVQGVAGSGKTTVALHRIAYLVYTYEKNFKPEEFLIIAPNKFFLDYISNVLPDLGVDDVKQQTFEEFAYEIIDSKFEIEDPNKGLSIIVNENEKEAQLVEKIAGFKSSMKFKEIIDIYLNELIDNILPNDDFKVLEYVVMKKQEIYNLLKETFKFNCLKESINILSNIMQKKIRDQANELYERITTQRKKEISEIDKNYDEETQQKIRNQIFEKSEYEIKHLLKGGKKLVLDYIKKIHIDNALKHYKNIIYNKALLIQNLNEEQYSYILKKFNEGIKNKKYEYEDLTPLLYIQYKIFGLMKKTSLKHIVIDEAQDLSEFQFYVLNEVLQNNKSITILGDIAQGIYSYRGTTNWEKINKEIFDNQANLEKLNNSYRTTSEIMNEANKVISKVKDEENISLAIPVDRHGEDVKYIKVKDFEDRIKSIKGRIVELKGKGYYNIAIITKNNVESQKLYDKLKNENLDVQLVSESLKKYYGGTIIVPSYLSKGLEFDSVIISNFNKYGSNKMDVKLLYVSFTRAMHTLDVLL